MHLVYFEEKFPYAKAVILTFVMPVFLLISGYLANMNKPLTKLARHIKWLAVPYAIMESGYIIMASILPIREHISQTHTQHFCRKAATASSRSVLVSAYLNYLLYRILRR